MWTMRNLGFQVAFTFAAVVWLSSFLDAQENDKKIILCSTTQVADFARQIVGDRWEVICVLGAGEDPHTHEVGADDKLNAAAADLCAENGWHLEGDDWMKKLAKEASKPIVTCVTGIKPLSLPDEGRTTEDPHAWFDAVNAITYVKNLRDAISQIDPAHQSEYQARAELYIRQLALLDGWIKKQVGSIAANRRLLVTHHDAFGYFCQAYRFKAISPIGWTTAELTEVTASDRQSVVKRIREVGVPAIFVETTLNKSLLEGIAADAGVAIGGELYSDAMGTENSAGETYIGMMRENVLTIVEALK